MQRCLLLCKMSVEDQVISECQLPKFRLTKAPRHVCSCPSQFYPGKQLQTTGSTKNFSHLLQTQECSRKFSSTLLLSQSSPSSSTAVSSSAAVSDHVSRHHVQWACPRAAGDRKLRSFTTSASPSSARGSGLNGPESARQHRSKQFTADTNSASMTLNRTRSGGLVVPPKDNSRPSASVSQTGGARPVKDYILSSQSSKELSAVTSNTVTDLSSCATDEQHCGTDSDKFRDRNCSNSLIHSAFKAFQPADDAACSKQQVEPGGGVEPHSDVSKRRIPVALLMQNGSVRGSNLSQTTARRDVSSRASSRLAASGDMANGIISRSVTPDLHTFQQPNNAADLPIEHGDNDTSHSGRRTPNSHEDTVDIKIEKRVISNTPMSICTQPVPKPAFFCKRLLPETSASTKATVTRSYHETTRPQSHVVRGDRSSGRRRSTAISRLPYVGADLWELTTQRLQRAIIDKVTQTSQNESTDSAAASRTSCETSLSDSPRTSPCSLQSADQNHGDVSRLTNKCLSAKTVRPKLELAIRGSQSTSRLVQLCAEEDDGEAIVDCDGEL